MAETKCFTVVRGKRMRVTRLDECGNPPDYGAENSLVVTKGFVQVGLSSEVESGDDITQKNADGDLCVNDRSRDQFKRWNTSIEFCEVDPAILEIISNAVLETDWNDVVVGVRIPEGGATESFALEVWSGVPGSDCEPDQPPTYGYFLAPFVIPGVLGDITIENGAATFTVPGFTRGHGGWGVGPYDVVPTDVDNTPGPLGTPVVEHLVMRTTTIAPPDSACGALPMPA